MHALDKGTWRLQKRKHPESTDHVDDSDRDNLIVAVGATKAASAATTRATLTAVIVMAPIRVLVSV